MKKLLVLAMVAVMALTLVVWAAETIKDTPTKALQSPAPTKSALPPALKSKPNAPAIAEQAEGEDQSMPMLLGKSSTEEKPEAPVTTSTPGDGIYIDHYDKSNDPVEINNQAIDEPAPVSKEEDASRSQTVLEFLQSQGVVIDQGQQPEKIEAAPYVEEPKWEPQYGEKGELLNPVPMIRLDGQDNAGTPGGGEIILVNKLTQDFEGAWVQPTPPGGWAQLDSGTEATQNLWWVDKWHKFYYNASGWYDTCLASMWSTPYVDSMQSTWAITPTIDLSAATTCTLFVKEYYDNVSTATDSANVMVSIDGGTAWARVRTFKADSTTTKVRPIVLNAYITNANVKVGFWHNYGPVAGSPTATNGWVIDDVRVKVDGTDLWTQTFSNQMSGWFGNTPPSGWSINSNGSNASRPKAWNNNDWVKRANSSWTGNCAAITYVGTNARREWENDWLLSPACTLSASVACTLSFVQLFSTDNMGNQFPPNTNYMPHYGYVRIQETTDNGANWGPWSNIDVYNNAQKGLSASKVTFKYDISSWATKAVRIAFQQVNNPDLNYGYWYIDDVKIDDYVHAADNVGTLSITSPIIGVQGRNWAVKPKVFNNGLNAETFVDSTSIQQINLKNSVFFEDFSNPSRWIRANPPLNNGLGTYWAVLDSGASAPKNDSTVWHAYYHSGWTPVDTVARVNYGSPTRWQNEWLITPTINCGALANVHLTFNTYYYDGGTVDTAWIYYSTDNWATRNQIAVWTTTQGSSSAPYVPDFDISAVAGNSNVQIGFKYVGNNNWYWYIDKVNVYEALSPLVVYTSTENVTAMPAFSTQVITYASTWNNPSPGTYTVTSVTTMVDSVAGDNSKSQNVTAYAHTGAIGPDGGSYTLKDDITGGGPAYSWIDISATGTPIYWNFGTGHTRYTAGLGLGFPFWYYGQTKSRIYLSEDGYITFDSLTSTYSTNYNFPYSSLPNNLIGFFWDDLIQSTGNAYFWTNNTDSAIVQFTNWGISATGDTLPIKFDAQVIFSKNDARIKMQYRKFEPGLTLGHSIGIENSGGTAGLQYVYNGAPMGNLPIPPLAITFYAPVDEIVASSLVSPASYMVAGATYSVQGRFKNNGSAGQTIDAQVVVDNGATNVVVKDTTVYGITINTSDSATVDFGSLVPATAGTYTFTLTAINPGDEIPSNNTLNVTRTVYAHDGTGGPDGGYYSWIDNTVVGGPTFGWADMSTATPVTFSIGTLDDGASYPVYLPSSFYFYGGMQTKVVFGTNGIILFDSVGASPSPYFSPIPDAATPNKYIGFMRSDMYARTGGTTYLNDVANNRFVMQYDSLYFYNTPAQSFDCQVILNYADSNIIIQYNNFNGPIQTDAVIGIENATGSTGLSYYYNATLLGGLGNFPYNGLAIKFYYTAPARDMALMSILNPGALVVNGATFTPQVRLANNGAISETFDLIFKIFDSVPSEVYNQTVTGITVGSGVQDTIDFPSTSIATNGAYSCSTYIVWTGPADPNPANDKLRSTFTVDTHYGEGGPDAGLYKWIDNFPPPALMLETPPTYSWIEINPDLGGGGTVLGTLSDVDDGSYTFPLGFTFNFYDTPYTTAYASTNGLITFGASSTIYTNAVIPTSATPNNMLCVVWDDWYYRYTVGSRLMYQNFTGYTVVEWYNFAKYSTGNPTLQFQAILYEDGHMIVQYKAVGGATDYLGESATIGMENSAGTSGLQYLYNGTPLLNRLVNNLAIKYYLYVPTIDVAMQTINEPAGYLSVPKYPKVTVRNVGTTAAAADVTVKIVGPAPAIDTLFNFMETTPSIPGLTSYPFTFGTNAWTPAALGTYTILASVTTAGDEFPANNTGSATLMVHNSPITVPYANNFDTDNSGFIGLSEWEWGIPTLAPPAGPTAHSAPNVWGTDLDDRYDNGVLNSLYFRPIDLTTATSAVAKFWYWDSLETNYDGANLKISSNFGTTWSVITTSLPYNGTGNAGAPGIAGQPTWTTYHNWTEVIVDLYPYLGQTVFLRLDQSSETSVNRAGSYIDDFSLIEFPYDAAIKYITPPAPVWTEAPGVPVPIGGKVTNFGQVPYTFDVRATVVGSISGPLYNNVVTVSSLAYKDSATVTFPTFTSVCQEQYAVTFTVEAVGDLNPANDTKVVYFDAFGAGWRTYHDGTFYWIMGITATRDAYAAKMRVPAGQTAVLRGLELVLYSSGTAAGTLTPTIWGSDINGAPDNTNVLWLGTPIAKPLVTGYFIVDVDLTAIPDPVSPTADFWIGFSSISTQINMASEGQLSTMTYPGNEYTRVSGVWRNFVGYWVTPRDVAIYCNYDMVNNFTDGAPLSIDSPQGTMLGPGPFDVLATMANYGSTAISGASATATITLGINTVFTATVTGIAIPVGGTTQVDFGNWIVAADTGILNYDITIDMTVPGDQDICTGTQIAGGTIVVNGAVQSVEDFETDNGGLVEVVSMGPPIWQWGTDAVVSPPPSGTKVWGTILGADYPISSCASLRSPSFSVPSVGGALAFYSWYELEPDWDYCNVKISADGGATFNLINPLGGYDSQDLQGVGNLCPLVSGQYGFSDVKGYWQLQAFDLASYAGQNVIASIDFASDGYEVDRGFYLDNLMVIWFGAVANVGVAPASISHVVETDVDNNYVADYTISNTGTGPLNWTSTNALAWITPSFEAGTVPPAGSVPIDLNINSTGITEGVYNDVIAISSNDPDLPLFNLPVTVTVSQVAPRLITIDVTISEGETQVVNLWVDNGSAVAVHVEATADQTPPPPPIWLSVAPPSVDIAANDSALFQVTVDASLLVPGNYTGLITITSSSIIATVITIPVGLEVNAAGCAYIPGDINGFGGPNGLDITYGVTYLKGGATPVDSCDCSPEVPFVPFYAAMDVNGNCQANGIDITFFVAYLKSLNPALLWCADCPPANPPVPAVEVPGLKAKNIKTTGGSQ